MCFLHPTNQVVRQTHTMPTATNSQRQPRSSSSSTCSFLPHELLPRHLLLRNLLLPRHILVLRCLRDDDLLLGENHLDVTRTRHVRVDPTVRSVRSSSHLRRCVHLDVLDDQPIDVQALVVGVRLGISEQLEEELGRLLRPSSLSASGELTALRFPSDSAVESSIRDDLLLRDHVLQVSLCSSKRHLLDRLSRFPSVLEVNPQVRSSRLTRLCRIVGIR